MTRTGSSRYVKPLKPLRKSSEAKRCAIKDAARDLFMEVGYEAASMNQIVALVGGSKGTIYSHFKNKEALFMEILHDDVREHIKPLYEIDLMNMDIRDGLTVIAEKTLKSLTSDKSVDLQRLIFSETKRLPMLGKIYYKHGPMIGYKRLDDLFKAEVEQGNLKCKDTKKAADYFWGMLLYKIALQRHCRVIQPLSKKRIQSKAREIVNDFLVISELI